MKQKLKIMTGVLALAALCSGNLRKLLSAVANVAISDASAKPGGSNGKGVGKQGRSGATVE